MSDQDDLNKLIKGYQSATPGLPPSIKPIDMCPMDITLGAFTEHINTAAINGGKIAINACISLLVSNPAISHQPAPYARRALEAAVEAELKKLGITCRS